MEQEKLLSELSEELNNTLEFWATHAIDKQHGGFAGEVDANGKMVPKADKGLVLNTRILWSFSAAYHFTTDERWIKLAHRAFDYLINHFYDQENGGFFWAVDDQGNVINDRKQVYGQGFAIYAFSEYFKATGKQAALDHAVELFDLLDKHSYDPEYGGYLEALSANWGKMDDVRLSLKDANCPKSMNTHLHVLEPFSNLYRVWPKEILRKRMKSLVRIFIDRILDKRSGHFHLFFDEDWTVRSNMISYGHDIEGTWLINEAASLTEDPELIREARTRTSEMAEVFVKEGIAPDNSVYYEKDPGRDELHKERHWWVQAEALVGLLDAYENTLNEDYFEIFLKIWRYIGRHVVDHNNGGWFGIIEDDGTPRPGEPKAGFWKCPYHNTRALIESIQRIKMLTSSRKNEKQN
ncbi:MAG: AGE family epimerase/isomerase [Marinilabiliaceae bacterium]